MQLKASLTALSALLFTTRSVASFIEGRDALGTLVPSSEGIAILNLEPISENSRSTLERRQGCPSGYGLCSNGYCCPLGGQCCILNRCCGAGYYCITNSARSVVACCPNGYVCAAP